MEPLIEEQIVKAMGNISQKIDTLTASVAGIDKKVDLHIQGMQYELKRNNEILDEHHKRSDAIQKDVELRDHATKLEIKNLEVKVERALIPMDVLKRSKKWILWAGGISAAIVAIVQLISLFKR